MAGRWIAGMGQLLVFLAGCAMIIMYFYQLDLYAYGQATGEIEPAPNRRLGEMGLILFVAGWFWALVTSLSLVIRAKPEEPVLPQMGSLPAAPSSAVPPKLTE
jgi:hypothetical protein